MIIFENEHFKFVMNGNEVKVFNSNGHPIYRFTMGTGLKVKEFNDTIAHYANLLYRQLIVEK